MSEEKAKKGADESLNKDSRAPEAQDRESLELTVNKATNEIIFTDPAGKVFVIQPKIIEPEPKEEGKKEPLTPEEFGEVLAKLDTLGITWSTDIPPSPIVTDALEWTTSSQQEYREIQKRYPRFPRELGNVILHALLGQKQPVGLVGSEEVLKRKVDLIRALLTQEYRSEFFFNYAIKVPYLEQLDWEIVVKAYERSITAMPKVAYALLSLTLRNPIDTTIPLERGAHERESQFITIALNERLIEKLMKELTVVKNQLEKAQKSAVSLTEQAMLQEGEGDEPNN